MYIYLVEQTDFREHEEEVLNVYRREEDAKKFIDELVKKTMMNREEYVYLDVIDMKTDFDLNEGTLYAYTVRWKDEKDDYDEEGYNTSIIKGFYIIKKKVL